MHHHHRISISMFHLPSCINLLLLRARVAPWPGGRCSSPASLTARERTRTRITGVYTDDRIARRIGIVACMSYI